MVVAARELMQRWRLRFNLQEIDLRAGTITLGRAAECPITLEDPLVSRRHAEIHVTDEGCTLVDLGSRNGVRLNGVRITAPATLQPNDRIRLGRDELVLLVDDSAKPSSRRAQRDTAASVACERCGQEHAAGMFSCPRCGATLAGISRSA